MKLKELFESNIKYKAHLNYDLAHHGKNEKVVQKVLTALKTNHWMKAPGVDKMLSKVDEIVNRWNKTRLEKPEHSDLEMVKDRWNGKSYDRRGWLDAAFLLFNSLKPDKISVQLNGTPKLCFQNAAEYAIENKCDVVLGLLDPKDGPDANPAIIHCWVKDGNKYVEPTSLRNRDVGHYSLLIVPYEDVLTHTKSGVVNFETREYLHELAEKACNSAEIAIEIYVKELPPIDKL